MFEEKPFFPIPGTNVYTLSSVYVAFYGVIILCSILIIIFIISKGYEIFFFSFIITIALILISVVLYIWKLHIYSAKPLKIYEKGIEMPRVIGYRFIESNSIKSIKIIDLTDDFDLKYYKHQFAEMKLITHDNKKYRTQSKSKNQIDAALSTIKSRWYIEDQKITIDYTN